MKTFTEQLRIKHTTRQLFEAFLLMSQKGVDPMRFVDWYTLDGLEKQNQGLLVEATEEWLISEGLWDKIKQGAGWVGQGLSDIATGNVDYKAMGDRWKKGGQAVGNVLTALPAAATAMAGGAARGVLGAGASNLAGGVMGGLGLGGNNKTDPAAPGGAPGKPGDPAAGGGAPGAGGKPEQPADPNAQHIQKAHAALDTLSKRMGNSKNLAQELGGQQFQSAVANLLYMLKNNQVVQQGGAAPAAGGHAVPPAGGEAKAPVPPAPAHDQFGAGADIGHHSESNGFAQFTNRIRLRNEIRTGLRHLQECRVDPVEFVEWYIEEGQYLKENAVGDWFGRQWAGLGGLFSGKGYSKAGEEWQTNKDKQRDDEAVQGAINALWQFQREMQANKANFMPDFAETLKAVSDGLQKRGAAAPAGGAPAGGGTPPTDGSAPPPPPPAGGDAEAEASSSGVSDEQLKGYTPIFQEKLKAAGADMTKFGDANAVAELAKQALSITRKDGQRDSFIAHVAKGGDPKAWTPPTTSSGAPPAPDAPQHPAPIEPGGESGSSQANTPSMEGVFYKYLKRRA